MRAKPTVDNSVNDQVEAYSRLLPSYQAFAAKLKALLEDLVVSNNIQLHVVEGRAKEIDSFREKLLRPGKSYNNGIEDITDLCGCRIIVYYLEDVDKVAAIVKRELGLVEEELSHISSSLQVDKFGYLSAHYIVTIGKKRDNLDEWRSFNNLKAEIQIRTVIQHAWSAVSHALQYKAEVEVPSKLQRRLYRIAGLFELADEEFGGIRNERLALRREASKALARGHKDIPLSSASIEEFIRSWPKIDELTNAGTKAGFTMKPEDFHFTGNIYDILTRVGLHSVLDLEGILNTVNFSKLREIYGGQRDKIQWTATPGFLMYILIIGEFIDKIDAEYLVGQGGWSRSIAEDVVKSLK